CIKDYLSPSFAHRGLVTSTIKYKPEKVLSYPIPEEDLVYPMNTDM
ncbi:11622_t:CDS:1, partial [Funneliformis caledonium]